MLRKIWLLLSDLRCCHSFFLGYLFFLPLFEAPKNILGICFIISAVLYLGRKEDWSVNYRGFPILVGALICVIISTLLAGVGSDVLPLTSRLRAATNWVLLPVIALLILGLPWSSRVTMRALMAICLGATLAYVEAVVSQEGVYPELRSVGHVNQSALFVTLSVLSGLWLIFVTNHYWVRSLAVICVAGGLLLLGPMRSLTAIISLFASLGLVFMLACIQCKVSGSALKTALVVSCLVIAGGISTGGFSGLFKEAQTRLASVEDPWSQRDRIANTALTVFPQSIWVGTGLSSFGLATHESRVKTIAGERDLDWREVRRDHFFTNHGHGLWTNVLVERGLLGIFAIGAYLTVTLGCLTALARKGQGIAPIMGLGIWVLVIIGGLGNSTLHVEHGALSMTLMTMACKRASSLQSG
jgi:hypothetical protein